MFAAGPSGFLGFWSGVMLPFPIVVQSVMHINLHYFRLIFPEAQAFIKVLVTQFHSEAAVLAWA